jgi:hypothetical protein
VQQTYLEAGGLPSLPWLAERERVTTLPPARAAGGA